MANILHGFSLVFVISFVFVIFLFSETRERAARQNCKGGRSIPVPADKNYMVNIRATTHHPPTIHHLFHFCETKVGWYKNNFFAKQLNEKDAGTLPKLICKWRGWMDHKLSRVAIRFPSGAPYQSQKKGFSFVKKGKNQMRGNSTSHFHPFSSQRVELLWQGSGLAAKWGRNCQKASSSKGSRDTSLSGSIFTEKIWITETDRHSHFQQTSGLCLKPPAPLRAPKEVILGVSPLVSPILQSGRQTPPILLRCH